MSVYKGRSLGRGVVAVAAAGALLVSLLASPASAADAPNDVSIKGLLKGGQIVLHQSEGEDRVFPLGEKGESTVKVKEGDSVCDPKDPKLPRSFFTADVDASGDADNFAFHFSQGSTGEKFTFFGQQYEVCAVLDVKNPTQIQGSINNKVMTLNPGPQVSTNFVIKRKPQQVVEWVCRIEIDQDTHTGLFAPPKDLGEEKQDHDWNLTHEPDTQPFEVDEAPATDDCPSLVANELNSSLGLPTTGEADFKWAVYDCDVKDCSNITGHPNK